MQSGYDNISASIDKGAYTMKEIIAGLLLPFIGTSVGAACVFFLRSGLNQKVQKSLLGFASGVMVAASVWSLLIPSMDMSEKMGRFAFVPAVVGLGAGFVFLLAMDKLIPHLHLGETEAEGPQTKLRRTTMLLLAVTLHNIPEGMAVGVIFAGMLADQAEITLAGAFALSIGIAIQNFPEGAIISLPLRSEAGVSRMNAFVKGVLSGVVEPIAGIVTILLSRRITPLLPYLLSFAAGAMLYVVVEELIPETAEGKHSNLGTIGFAVGFALMMVLDVALG